jgi:1-acyl-sn-glycerol-3-phosphate acyltransferase
MSAELPPQWGWLFNGFRKYCVRYAGKQFHAVRLARASAKLPLDGKPVLVAISHPSWWDAILIFVLTREFEGYAHYGPMDAKAIEKYQFMKRAGLFPLELESVRGAASLLKTGMAVLSRDKHVLWLMPQGHFADVRDRPLNFRSGVGHLAARMKTGWVLPVAVEYPFWNESKPEALVRYGEPIRVSDHSLDGKGWTALLEAKLTETMDALALDARSRDATRFVPLVQGKVGIGGVYDLWRRFKATISGRKFDPSHEGLR